MPSTFAIETSSKRGSAAVRIGGCVRETLLAGERAHASDLLPQLDRIAREAGVERRLGTLVLDAVVVGTGPGSYTGLRVGMATALGLARATGAVLRGVPSVEALAFAELSVGEEGAIALDARAGRFYFARYRRTKDDVETLVAPSAVTAEELRRLLLRPGPILGDEAVGRAAELTDDALARLRTDVRPRAGAALTLGLRRLETLGPDPVEELAPLYLRAFGEL